MILDECLSVAKSIHDGKCIIAGGAVRDYLMGVEPKDIDVFYLNSGFAKLRKAFQYANEMEAKPFPRHHRLVAECTSDYGKLQVFATPIASVEDFLDTCDWNVSAFAFDGEVHSRETVDSIAPGKPLRLFSVTNPVSTLRRGFEFSTRFDMTFPTPLLDSLCRAVVSKKNDLQENDESTKAKSRNSTIRLDGESFDDDTSETIHYV